MKLFALSDPHLAQAVPDKTMDRFGANWVDHPAKIRRAWEESVGPGDVVAVPGDISWAKKFDQALEDLRWLGSLPGRKVILKGNHDIWWPTSAQLEREAPPGMHFIHNNHARVGPFTFFGARLWDTEEYSTFDLIDWDPRKGPIPGPKTASEIQAQEKLYDRELERLKLSALSLPDGGLRIALTHFPPLGPSLAPSRASALIEGAGARHVIFGHLHSVREEARGAFGEARGVTYHLSSCDFLDFKPKLVCEA